jgi:DNA-binding response OmpR family regulator
MLQQLRIDLHDLGYRPSVAASVEQAREVLENERVAAVLLDLVLDEHEDSGFELLTWIRHHHPGLPVIVLSAAQVNSASIRRAYELGASSYFVKGNVPMAHIYSDLAARLVERGTGRPGTYRFGRLEFDPTGRTVRMDDREARLTQQQAAVVLFLAQRSKPTTARDLIQAGLFRNNAAHSTVHSALLTLRRRLDELEPGLGTGFVQASARGYSLVAVHD